MNIIQTSIPDVLIVEPKIYTDRRGFFFENYSLERYRQAGIDTTFVQDNISSSEQGVLRGLHFQNPNPQGKLVYVLEGKVFDVAVDIRKGSPTYGKWTGHTLTDNNKYQLWIPPGFAHGFYVMSESALFCYKCTDYYNADADISIAWNDSVIGINWPTNQPILSNKDKDCPMLEEISDDLLPIYGVSN